MLSKNERGEGQAEDADEAGKNSPSPRSPDAEIADAGRNDIAERPVVARPAVREPKVRRGPPNRRRKGQARSALSALPDDADAGQVRSADEAKDNAPTSASTNGGGEGHCAVADEATYGVPAPPPTKSDDGGACIITAIRHAHRLRCFHMEQRKRSDLSLGSFLRLVLGWSRALPADERKRISAHAQKLIEIGEDEDAGKPFASDYPGYAEWRETILASINSRGPHDAIEERATKEMEQLAKLLPVWASFAKDVRGFGARSLGVIIGEAGDLGVYPKKGHLWKRMGLAVIDGVRQGGLRKSATKQDWIRHGYNRQRRSRMFVIGDCLVKSGDHYRAIYLARKEYERERATAAGLIVAPAAKIPEKRASEFISDGHIHRRAQRYMEKILLRDLWAAWRRAIPVPPEGATPAAPAAETSEAKAYEVAPKAVLDLPTPRTQTEPAEC